MKYWPFGSTWCSIWLAVDVWMCTASILNLCAISFDRYLAISRPFRYPQLMSTLRVKILLVCVWILSFVICLPPLVGWNERRRHNTVADASNETRNHLRRSEEGDGRQVLGLECTLADHPGYVIYSAVGSFWIPMVVMLAFYWRIYRTAAQATAAFRRGFVEKKGTLSSGHATRSASTSDSGHSSVTLRVHRGGGMSPTKTAKDRANPDGNSKAATMTATARGSSTRCAIFCEKDSSRSSADKHRRRVVGLPRIVITPNDETSETVELMTRTLRDGSNVTTEAKVTRSRSAAEMTSSRMWKLQSILPQLRCLNREKKAAKTVGVIVGCFVLCWAPFFTVYLLGSFCHSCTPSVVFDVCFWLGYCNSAINPFIYGVCSRDFCYAFKKLLRCRCERRRGTGRTEGGNTFGRSKVARILRSLRIQIATNNFPTTATSVSDVNV